MPRGLFIIIKKTAKLKSKDYKEGTGKATKRGQSTCFSSKEIKDGQTLANRSSTSRL
jgi:hypothetical protein